MAPLKTFSELSMQKDKDLKNLKIPVKGPKGTSKHMRMKVTNAPGADDIKKAVNSGFKTDANRKAAFAKMNDSVQSADRKPEKYLKPDGKVGVRMVKTDKEVIKKEASVLKPTKPSDITKHARTLAKNSGDYERNKKKYIDKARAKVFRMYPKESLNGLMKEESVDQLDEKMLPIVKVMRKNKRLIDNELGASHKDYKAYVMIDDEYLDRLNDSQSELIFSSLKKNKGVAYPENDITAYFKSENTAKQFVKDLGGPGSMYGKYGRLDINLTALGRGIKKESVKEMIDPMDLRGRPKKRDPNPESPYGMKHPLHPVNLAKKKAKEAEKAKKEEATWPNEMPIDEALTMTQRMKKSRLMKRLKARIKIGRDRAKKKMANKDKLEKRANRQARNQIANKLTRGVPKRELSFARKQEIEKRLDKPALKQRIKRLAKRLFKDVRKKEVQRKKG